MAPGGATVAIVVGTRPEVIKMAPVHAALAAASSPRPILVATGQHRELLDGALAAFGLTPDFHLDIMRARQDPNQVVAAIMERLPCLLDRLRPSALLVQGDTTTVLASALVAFHMGIPVGHVEAGLRTGDLQDPFPEEANRQLVDRMAEWCFVPTEGSRQNLISEGIAAPRVFVTGNTAVDALLWARVRTTSTSDAGAILVTLHRRESFGPPMRGILRAIVRFLDETPDAHCVWPVHPNPGVRSLAKDPAVRHPRLRQVRPLPYLGFVALLQSCRLVVTDSGGIQEEAPSLGKHVLVVRQRSERPEAIGSGLNWLVGRSEEQVLLSLREAWVEPPYDGPIPAPNPYGDGKAGERIAAVLAKAL